MEPKGSSSHSQEPATYPYPAIEQIEGRECLLSFSEESFIFHFQKFQD